MSSFPDILLPCLLLLACGLVFRRVDVASAFARGAEEGLKTALKTVPVILPTLTLLGMLSASGFTDLLCAVLTPFAEKIGFPVGALPVVLLRPLSGSASLAAAREVLSRYGADSREGVTAASVLAGGETALYVLGLYWSGKKVKNGWKIVLSILFGYAALVLAAAWEI